MEQSLLSRVEKQAWFHKYPRGWPLLLFFLACIGTGISVLAIERSEDERREAELDRNMAEIASALERRATENVALLRAGAALFETQGSVSASQFEEYSDGIRFDNNLHGALGMGWAPLVPADQVTLFEIAQRRESGNEAFQVYPRPRAEARYVAPIVFLVPPTRLNRLALGYDMYSDVTRRDAMEEAVRLDGAAATGRVELLQDKDRPGTAGFLIYVPVETYIDSHRVQGFVYSPFRAEDFLESAAELFSDRNVEISLYDQERVHENLLTKRSLPGQTGLSMTRSIQIANRQWVLQVSNKRTGMLSPLSRVTLFFGAVAALMVMAIGQLITTRAMADRRMLETLSRQSAIRNSLTRELNHRVKNTLANVLSIVALTRNRSRNIDDFSESLTSRIRALSATHDLLSQTDWADAAIADIVSSELAPYKEGDGSRVDISGPDISLAPNDAMSLGLAIHELATNAAKYGALSVNDGKVWITWRRIAMDLVELDWKETGGPPVREPGQRGFGRDLIEKIVSHEFGTNVDLRFEPAGVECTLKVPVRKARDFSLRKES